MAHPVGLVVPFRGGCSHREAALGWMLDRYNEHHPDWPVFIGTSPPGPFNRSAAILDAAHACRSEMLVVSDGDVWCDPFLAVEAADETGWAVPHTKIHRLSADSTRLVLDGADWHGLPLSEDNTQDQRPYRGNETGTLLVIKRDVLLDVPPDVRFVGWGSEDVAWGLALRALVGIPWRGPDPLVHLWHPPQPRLTRAIGSQASRDLLMHYRGAQTNPVAMRALVDEAR